MLILAPLSSQEHVKQEHVKLRYDIRIGCTLKNAHYSVFEKWVMRIMAAVFRQSAVYVFLFLLQSRYVSSGSTGVIFWLSVLYVYYDSAQLLGYNHSNLLLRWVSKSDWGWLRLGRRWFWIRMLCGLQRRKGIRGRIYSAHPILNLTCSWVVWSGVLASILLESINEN